jgi:hypothetical protein
MAEGSGGGLPDWITDLRPLRKVAPFATSLFVLMTDPVRWIRQDRGQPIFEWVVSLFLVKPFAYLQSFILQGFGALGDSIGWLADGAVSTTASVAAPFLAIPATLEAAIQSALEGLGLAAPIAGAAAGLILFLIGGAVISATVYGILALTQTDGIVEGVDEWL